MTSPAPLTKDEAIALLRDVLCEMADVFHSPSQQRWVNTDAKIDAVLERTATLAEEKCPRCGHPDLIVRPNWPNATAHMVDDQ